AVQMIFAYVVVRPDQAALEDREVALDRVGSHVAASVFLDDVIHSFMFQEIPLKFFVLSGLIGMNASVSRNLRVEDRAQRRGINAGDVERAHGSFALNQREDRIQVAMAFALN